MSNRVFVLDTEYTPLAPCHPARARELLNKKQAAVYRTYPFTIILKYTADCPQTNHLELKIDPGSKTTGMSIISHGTKYTRVVFALNVVHRGLQIVAKLLSRRQSRNSRRSRKTRYREPRFNNRGTSGWIPPSTQSRIDNVTTWLLRFIKYCGVSGVAVEIAKFDMARMRKPGIKGTQYQQGTLQGYNVKAYLLQLYRHTCVYCRGASKDRILEIEHVIPKSKGGTNCIANLTLSCKRCNADKGSLSLLQWIKLNTGTPALRKARVLNIPKVLEGLKPTLRDATVMNIIIPRLLKVCDSLGFDITNAYGYQTKYNRLKQHYRKDHWIDAACISDSGKNIYIPSTMRCLTATTTGHHNRQMQRPDKYGFPRTATKGPSIRQGFRSGDIVKALVPGGKYKGTHLSRATHFSGGLALTGGVYTNPKYCSVVQHADGYRYHHGTLQHYIVSRQDTPANIYYKTGGTYTLCSTAALTTCVSRYI